MNDNLTNLSIQKAAEQILGADHFLILAGAGMGVDSGLPDFRGNDGFWNAYPPFKEKGLSFYDLANPVWFATNPKQAWGFYGHRLSLYRATRPHGGFETLLSWAARAKSHFVFTSNVDGHFQRSGFSENSVIECHGSFSYLQCHQPCSSQLWTSEDIQVEVDPESFLAEAQLPACPNCGLVARPNILMFGDSKWISANCDRQLRRYDEWYRQIDCQDRLVLIEIGAGTAVPTVRLESESRLLQKGTALIRINPRESDGPPGTLSIALGGRKGINRLAKAVDKLSKY